MNRVFLLPFLMLILFGCKRQQTIEEKIETKFERSYRQQVIDELHSAIHEPDTLVICEDDFYLILVETLLECDELHGTDYIGHDIIGIRNNQYDELIIKLIDRYKLRNIR